MVKSKIHTFLLSCLFKAKSKYVPSQVLRQIHYSLFLTVVHSEGDISHILEEQPSVYETGNL
jgi:hypothetical protein